MNKLEKLNEKVKKNRNPDTDRVIILVKRKVRDRLKNFCENYKSEDGFTLRMSQFGDVAITEKLDKMEEKHSQQRNEISKLQGSRGTNTPAGVHTSEENQNEKS